MKRILLTMVAVLSLCGCAHTSDADFASKLRLYFAASDRYHSEMTLFVMCFHTTDEIIWPGGRQLSLFVDGKLTDFPRDLGWYVKYDHILPDVGRSVGWWLTVPELKEWIGEGEHDMFFTFGSVKSNVLRIMVPDSGRVICTPEYENASWRKDR